MCFLLLHFIFTWIREGLVKSVSWLVALSPVLHSPFTRDWQWQQEGTTVEAECRRDMWVVGKHLFSWSSPGPLQLLHILSAGFCLPYSGLKIRIDSVMWWSTTGSFVMWSTAARYKWSGVRGNLLPNLLGKQALMLTLVIIIVCNLVVLMMHIPTYLY